MALGSRIVATRLGAVGQGQPSGHQTRAVGKGQPSGCHGLGRPDPGCRIGGRAGAPYVFFNFFKAKVF